MIRRPPSRHCGSVTHPPTSPEPCLFWGNTTGSYQVIFPPLGHFFNRNRATAGRRCDLGWLRAGPWAFPSLRPRCEPLGFLSSLFFLFFSVPFFDSSFFLNLEAEAFPLWRRMDESGGRGLLAAPPPQGCDIRGCFYGGCGPEGSLTTKAGSWLLHSTLGPPCCRAGCPHQVDGTEAPVPSGRTERSAEPVPSSWSRGDRAQAPTVGKDPTTHPPPSAGSLALAPQMRKSPKARCLSEKQVSPSLCFPLLL